MQNPQHESDVIAHLVRAIGEFRQAVERLDPQEADELVSTERIVEALLDRDCVAAALLNLKDPAYHSELDRFVAADAELSIADEQLRELGSWIAGTIDLARWRKRIHPPEEDWWWYFEAELPVWQRLDWLWNMLTAGVLAWAASHMYNIYSAIAVGDANVAKAFSAIAQISGLFLLGTGALSEQGQRKVKFILSSLGIPPSLHAKVTLLASVVLLLFVLRYDSRLSDAFYRQGHDFYRQGQLSDAELKFLQGMTADPKDRRFDQPLGEVYESLGYMEKAIEYYSKSVQGGDYRSLSDLGRAYIVRTDPITEEQDPSLAEAYLFLALERIQAKTPAPGTPEEQENLRLLYEVNKDIGWSQIEQGRFETAEPYLKKAIEYDQQVPGNQPSGGMAYCFLAYVYDQLTAEEDLELLGAEVSEPVQESDPMGPSKALWKQCVEHARPQFIHEYHWFLKVGQEPIAYCVDTDDIVAGPRQDAEIETGRCVKLLEELSSPSPAGTAQS